MFGAGTLSGLMGIGSGAVKVLAMREPSHYSALNGDPSSPCRCGHQHHPRVAGSRFAQHHEHIYAEVDLEMKAKALANCEIRGNASGKHWKEDISLMRFLQAFDQIMWRRKNAVWFIKPLGE
jgi:hypothetical protein